MQRAGLDFTDLNVKNMDQIPVVKTYLRRLSFAVPNVLLTAGLRLLNYVFLNYGNFFNDGRLSGCCNYITFSDVFTWHLYSANFSCKLRIYILTESI